MRGIGFRDLASMARDAKEIGWRNATTHEDGSIDLGSAEDARPTRDWLVPIGDTGIYTSPNDPVDPRDCEKWPSSPYCGGSGINPYVPKTDIGISLDKNPCEICLEIQPTILFIDGPPTYVCYRKEDCRSRPIPNPEPLPDDIGDDGGDGRPFSPMSPRASSGMCRLLFAITLVQSYNIETIEPRLGRPYETYSYTLKYYPGVTAPSPNSEPYYTWYDGPRRDLFGPNNYIYGNDWSIPGPIKNIYGDDVLIHYPPWRATAKYLWISPSRLNYISRNDEPQSVTKTRIIVHFYWTDLYLWEVADSEYYESVIEYHEAHPNPGLIGYTPSDRGKLIASSCHPAPYPVQPPSFFPNRPNNPEAPPMPCNCAEIEDLLRDIYNRLGCEQFPVSVPPSLFGDASGTLKLGDHVSLWGYLIQNLDALLGEWPITVEIEDEDPTQSGNQSKTIRLPNIAETLAELFGITYNTSIGSDLNTEISLRIASEVMAAKIAALIAQDYAKANANFLGYKGNPKAHNIDFSFDPTHLNHLPDLLKNSKQKVIGWVEDDKESLIDYLQRLMFAAGIIRSVFLRDKDSVGTLLEGIDSFVEETREAREDWERFIAGMNDPNSIFNVGKSPKRRVNDLD